MISVKCHSNCKYFIINNKLFNKICHPLYHEFTNTTYYYLLFIYKKYIAKWFIILYLNGLKK